MTRGIVATTPTGLAQAVERYAARGVRVAIEAGNQTAWIVDLLRELGAKVQVVHPLKVKLIAESKKKTDRIDAQLLAHLRRVGGLRSRCTCPATGANVDRIGSLSDSCFAQFPVPVIADWG